MCQLCVHRDMKHLGSLESAQEARVAQGVLSRISRSLQTSRVLHNHISMNACKINGATTHVQRVERILNLIIRGKGWRTGGKHYISKQRRSPMEFRRVS